jgi:hypothetical protein
MEHKMTTPISYSNKTNYMPKQKFGKKIDALLGEQKIDDKTMKNLTEQLITSKNKKNLPTTKQKKIMVAKIEDKFGEQIQEEKLKEIEQKKMERSRLSKALYYRIANLEKMCMFPIRF